MKSRLLLAIGMLGLSAALAYATNTHLYGPTEYDTIPGGISPNGQWAITTHGVDEYGDDHQFHVYLTNAKTGKKIGPLEEISEILDTGASSYSAQWSADSTMVTICWRADRHQLDAMTYKIGNNRAYPQGTPTTANDAQQTYWQKASNSGDAKSPKIFGTPVAK